MSLSKPRPVLFCTLVLAAGLTAQKGRAPVDVSPPSRDPGVPVEMFESANLDRFLRRAQDFLGQERYGQAIRVLQDIIEGRTGEFVDPDEEKEKAAKAKAEAEAAKKAAKKTTKRGTQGKQPSYELPIDDDNPAYSVFSNNDRVYRPVARLCHELLASMPAEGIGLYRVKYEAQAEKQYEKALETGDLSELEAVHNNYFATLSSARAMQAAADLLMDAGRFRAAIQTLNNLLGVYPMHSRREAGIRDLVLMIKMAVCFQQLGELDLAREQLAAATQAFPEASVRIMGELYTVKLLHESELFDASSLPVTEHHVASSIVSLANATSLVPLWEYRFTDARPYANKAQVNRNAYPFNRTGQIVHGTHYPRLDKNVPGTTVQFLDDGLLFLDNYRPVVHGLTTGRQRLAMGDPTLAKPRSTTLSPMRSRMPAYDYFANRVAMDEKRFYTVEGYNKSASGTASFRVLSDNKLVAYDRKSGERLWLVDSRANRKRPITFLATPTVYRHTLLLPFLDAGSYGLLCLGAADGAEIFRTYLHYRGTAFARAPSPQVVVDSGIAHVLTNAGVVASVDANTGVLNWSRKYERVDPASRRFRPTRRARNVNMFGRGVQPQPHTFRGFAPTNLYVIEDLVLVAAVDSTVLLCLNGATGEIRWRHNAEQPQDPSPLADKLSYVIGHNKEFLFLMVGDAQLLCVGIKSGLRYWAVRVPGMDFDGWAGRGVVTDDFVALPGKAGSRRIHVIPANSKKQPAFATLELPNFSIGKQPLTGPTNLFVGGAYLACSYEGGVEVYSTAEALGTLAQDTASRVEQAGFLVHAGKLRAAANILFEELKRENLEAAQRDRLSIRVLSLVGDLAATLATEERRDDAFAILDKCEKHMQSRRFVLRVHLFRLQVYRKLNDIEGIEREQEFIENGGIK